eukprot:9259105-Lingulodinium_polyedra.AAC.1
MDCILIACGLARHVGWIKEHGSTSIAWFQMPRAGGGVLQVSTLMYCLSSAPVGAVRVLCQSLYKYLH